MKDATEKSFWHVLAEHTLPFLNHDSDPIDWDDNKGMGIFPFQLLVRHKFFLIFPADGVDVINGTYYDRGPEENVDIDEKITGISFFKAFFSTPPYFSGEPQKGNFSRAGIFILNSVKTSCIAISRLPKLVTEFLPAYLQALLWKSIDKLLTEYKDVCTTVTYGWWGTDKIDGKVKNSLQRLRCGAFIGIAVALFVVAKCWNVVGTAVTSPGRGMREGWKAGSEIGAAITDDSIWQPRLSKAFGGLLAGLSLAITVTVYVVVFPLGIKAIATNAPAFVSAAINAINNSPFVQGLGSAVARVACAAAISLLTCVAAGWNKIKRIYSLESLSSSKEKAATGPSHPAPRRALGTRRGGRQLYQSSRAHATQGRADLLESDVDTSESETGFHEQSLPPSAQAQEHAATLNTIAAPPPQPETPQGSAGSSFTAPLSPLTLQKHFLDGSDDVPKATC